MEAISVLFVYLSSILKLNKNNHNIIIYYHLRICCTLKVYIKLYNCYSLVIIIQSTKSIL